ncbi:MAG: TIGR04283 family arsenosugar biosynthesis glycosyltransferase [Chromatocurvus sp.]
MKPLCSFIIPMRNEEGVIGPLLADLRRRFAGCELIVIDGKSTDRSINEAFGLADAVLLGAPGRAAQMNLGAACAAGDYLFFLHADTQPCFSLTQLQQAMSRAPAWGFCRVRLSGSHRALRVVECAMNIRSRFTRVATGDQLMFVSRGLFQQAQGFAPLPLMEDVELCKRLRRRHRPVMLDAVVCTSSRRWEQNGILRTVLTMWWLRFLYVCGVSPTRLWRLYYGS